MAKTRNFESAINKLDSLGDRLDTHVPEVVHDRATKMAISAQDYVIAQDAIAHGILLEGIHATYEWFIPGNARIKVVSEAPYSGYVEYGTGIHALPLSPQYDAPDFSHALVHAILEWMIVKPSFTLRPTFHRALQISEKISETGTEAKPFMKPALRDHRYLLSRDVKSAVRKAIRRATIGY